MPRLKLALNLPRNDSELATFARHIASRLEGNPYFPALPVSLATLLGHVADLEAAQVAVQSVRHAAAERNAKRVIVTGDLEQDKNYVETVANQHGPEAEAVAASSGFDTKETRGPGKWVFAVEQGDRSGEAKLYAPRMKRESSYYWQLRTEETPWVDLSDSSTASTVATGLVPGALYYFRYSTMVGNVRSDWSDPITFRVT